MKNVLEVPKPCVASDEDLLTDGGVDARALQQGLDERAPHLVGKREKLGQDRLGRYGETRVVEEHPGALELTPSYGTTQGVVSIASVRVVRIEAAGMGLSDGGKMDTLI